MDTHPKLRFAGHKVNGFSAIHPLIINPWDAFHQGWIIDDEWLGDGVPSGPISQFRCITNGRWRQSHSQADKARPFVFSVYYTPVWTD